MTQDESYLRETLADLDGDLPWAVSQGAQRFPGAWRHFRQQAELRHRTFTRQELITAWLWFVDGWCARVAVKDRE